MAPADAGKRRLVDLIEIAIEEAVFDSAAENLERRPDGARDRLDERGLAAA